MDKTVVKEHIVLAAAKSFAQKGVKTVRMDDIAAGLSISKRTLYELFHDKEDLLLDVMKLHREEMQEYMTQVASKAENVLEVLLKFFQRSAQEFQNTNRKFFEDIDSLHGDLYRFFSFECIDFVTGTVRNFLETA